MVTAWSRLKAAGAWVASHWKWFLFPLGVITWLIGRASGKTVVQVQSPELEEHFELSKKLDKEAAKKTIEAAKKRDASITTADNTAAAETKRVQAEATERAAKLQSDPVALNDFLKKVGKDVRGKR